MRSAARSSRRLADALVRLAVVAFLAGVADVTMSMPMAGHAHADEPTMSPGPYVPRWMARRIRSTTSS